MPAIIPPLNITEEDGAPSAYPYKAKFSNGSVTDNGDGTVSIAGGGGGGAETDPIFSGSPAFGITGGQITNWDTAYGWGNHASAGYLTSIPAHAFTTLTDVPSSYAGMGGKVLAVKGDLSGLEFVSVGGGSGVTTLNSLSGDISIAGTTNQISATASGTSITLTTPQDTHTSARPTFGAMTLDTSTVTANTPILSGSQTWDNSAVSFRGININITNTSSSASSRPFSFTVGANAFYMIQFGGLVHSLTQDTGSSLIGYSQVATWNASYTMNAVNVAITDTLSGLNSSLFRGVVNGTEVFVVRKSGRILSPFYQFRGGTVSVFNAAADNNQGALGGAFTFNNASYTFHGILLDLTNTASGGNSSLIYARENGSERIRQYANGRFYVTTATLTASPGTTPVMRFASTVDSAYTYHSFDISSTHTASSAGSTLFRVTDGTDAKLTVNKFGSVICNSSAIATNATDGFVYIPTTPGTPTGVPRAYTGRVAMHYDTSDNRLWVYNGAWRSVALA